MLYREIIAVFLSSTQSTLIHCVGRIVIVKPDGNIVTIGL